MGKTGVTIYVEEELVEEFDDKVWELKRDQKIDREESRSSVMQDIMEAWVEGKSSSPTPKIMAD